MFWILCYIFIKHIDKNSFIFMYIYSKKISINIDIICRYIYIKWKKLYKAGNKTV